VALSGLYLITDRRACGDRSIQDVVQAAIDGGLKVLQYREKELPKRETYKVARILRELTSKTGVIFVINDDLDLVLAVEADGVHLGQEDLPLPVAREILGDQRIIGISARNVGAAKRAIQEGANYIAVGPIFMSRVKQVTSPLGCKIIREIRKLTDLPLFGIGGIGLTNVGEVVQAGADGVTVISALHEARDVTKTTREFLDLLRNCKKDTIAQ